MTTPVHRRMLRFESAMWRGLFRWLTRRPDVPAGSTGFGYARGKTPVLVTFVVLCALETVAFHLLLPWPAVRIPIDVVSVYGVIWMLGLLGATWTRPHLVGPGGLHIRDGLVLDVAVGWDAVVAVRARLRPISGGGSVQLDRSGERVTASIPALGQTTVDVVLRHPVPVPVRGGGTELADELRFHADDAGALVAAARAHLPADEPA